MRPVGGERTPCLVLGRLPMNWRARPALVIALYGGSFVLGLLGLPALRRLWRQTA